MRALLAALVLLPCAANAQQPQQPACMPWPQALMMLKQQYNETIIGGGQVDADKVIQVLASPEGKTWSIIVISRDGKACPLAGGKDWDPGELPVGGEPT